MSEVIKIRLDRRFSSLKNQPLAIEAMQYAWQTFPVETTFRVSETRIVTPRQGRVWLTGYYWLDGLVVHGKTIQEKHRKQGGPPLEDYGDDALLLTEVYDDMGDPTDEPRFTGWMYVRKGDQDLFKWSDEQ